MTIIDRRRREVLKSAAADLVALQAGAAWAGVERKSDVEFAVPEGVLQLTALDERALRVRVVPLQDEHNA